MLSISDSLQGAARRPPLAQQGLVRHAEHFAAWLRFVFHQQPFFYHPLNERLPRRSSGPFGVRCRRCEADPARCFPRDIARQFTDKLGQHHIVWHVAHNHVQEFLQRAVQQ